MSRAALFRRKVTYALIIDAHYYAYGFPPRIFRSPHDYSFYVSHILNDGSKFRSGPTTPDMTRVIGAAVQHSRAKARHIMTPYRTCPAGRAHRPPTTAARRAWFNIFRDWPRPTMISRCSGLRLPLYTCSHPACAGLITPKILPAYSHTIFPIELATDIASACGD